MDYLYQSMGRYSARFTAIVVVASLELLEFQGKVILPRRI